MTDPDRDRAPEPAPESATERVTAAAIAAAVDAIDARFLDTPQLEFEAVNDALGARLLLKVETVNPIRSFKGRGASAYVAALGRTPPRLVCASAGNFGQGLAWAARARGVALTIFAAEGANPLKIERMRALGAEVRLAGHDFDAAKAAARDHAEASGARYVEDGREPEVTIGAGTIGLELDRDPEPIDAVLVPVGNGALIGGVGTWFRAHRPTTRIVGVVAEGAPAMRRSWERGGVVETDSAETVADGIAVRVPVPAALEVMADVVDAMVAVADDEILAAMRVVHEHAGLVVEPAGAAGLAAVLAHPERWRGRRVATPLCGSNLTPEQMRRWLA